MPKIICGYRGEHCTKQDGTLCRSENPDWCIYSNPKSKSPAMGQTEFALVSACKDLAEIQGFYDKDPWACGGCGDMAEKWSLAIKNVIKETRALLGT
jgi:hypothetical protein